MDTQVAVDDEMFALLESYAGKETSDDRVIQLAGEAMCYYGFTGQYYIEEVPKLDDSILETWDRVDAWLEKLCGIIGEELLPIGIPKDTDIYSDQSISPLDVYGSLDAFKKLAIQKYIEQIQEYKSGVAFVEVTNNGQILNLVYDDLDDWAFDFNDCVKVFRDSDFTEENGYYEG